MISDGEPSIDMPSPANVSMTLTFDPVTLKAFSAILIHMVNVCGKLY